MSRGGSGAAATRASAWADESVMFAVGGITIYGTYRHPTVRGGKVPAVLLIAGSGPTDRNGNSPLLPGPVDTLKTVADWLSADGVASLRYDKLGSGQTGLGRFATDPGAIGIAPFEQEAVAALNFLADEPGVNRRRLAVIGHSEGALFALMLATDRSGTAPSVHAIALLEPLSIRYLDLVTDQVRAQAAAAIRSGRLTRARAAELEDMLAIAIKSLRVTGQVPGNLAPGFARILNRSTALFLSQADRFDPAELAARLPAHFPVLLTCSDADIEVTCTEVRHLLAGAPASANEHGLGGAQRCGSRSQARPERRRNGLCRSASLLHPATDSAARLRPGEPVRHIASLRTPRL